MQLALITLATCAPSIFAWSQQWKADFGHLDIPPAGRLPLVGADAGETAAAANGSGIRGNGTFKQLIDHTNPSLGTFDQFYYWSSEFWKGPGSPVIILTPGEVNATKYSSYLTTNYTTGVIAKQLGAAVFIMEHRYWGTSSPVTDLTTANMKYLTLSNAIQDLNYFANNIVLPWNSSVKSTAKDVPWVQSGASYSGALAAWTESVAPGTYWAYHSSSAPVEAISNFWELLQPIQEGMAKNCSTDVNLVIEYMDSILTSGNQSQIQELKAMFKMGDVEHNDDFMGALADAPVLWQNNQFFTGYSAFFQWCDYIENAINTTNIPGAEGVGLQKALQGYAKWWTDVHLPDYCYDTYGYSDFNSTYNVACYNTYNASNPIFTDTSLANTGQRQWHWMLCNQPFGWWVAGEPEGRTTLVSRLVTADWYIRRCGLYFPTGPQNQTYGIAEGKTEDQVNVYTQGWNDQNSTRLIYVTGQFDPWKSAGVGSEFRPGGPIPNTSAVPHYQVPGGFHGSDLVTKNGVVNASCGAVINVTVAQIVQWVGEWPGAGNGGWQTWTA